MDRIALFMCVRSGKALLCREYPDSLEYGSGFPPKGKSIDEILAWFEKQKSYRSYPLREGYFDMFVQTHTPKLKRLK